MIPKSKYRLAKARFWRKAEKNSMFDPKAASNSEIVRMSGDTAVAKQLTDGAFYAWFMEKETTKQLIDSSVELAVVTLIGILEAEVVDRGTVTTTHQLQAANSLLDKAGYSTVSTKEIIFKDKKVQDMSEEELEKYIRSKAKELTLSTGDSLDA